MQDAAYMQGYDVLIATTRDDPEHEMHLLGMLFSKAVDGAVLLAPKLDSRTISELAKKYQLAMCLERLEDCNILCVTIDNERAALDILTLCCGRLSLSNSLHQCVEVLLELLCAERRLADGAVNDVSLVKTILDLTSLSFLNSLSYVRGNSTSLGVRHEASRTEDLTESTNNAHHIGSCDNNFEVHPAAVDLSNGVVVSDVICASVLGSLLLVSLAEYQGAYLLTGTVGQDDRAADLLVGVTGVNAQLDVQLNGLVELGGSTLHDQIQGFGGIILNRAVDQFGALLILFTSKQCNYPP